jgi:hypothetical protein
MSNLIRIKGHQTDSEGSTPPIADNKDFCCVGKLWRTSREDMAQGSGPSLPQYCSCGWPMCLDYVSFFEEFPSGGEVVCQKMASQFEEGHQDGKKMLAHAQQE